MENSNFFISDPDTDPNGVGSFGRNLDVHINVVVDCDSAVLGHATLDHIHIFGQHST